ncbi:MAG: ABC transporter substrate-binding protein [Rhodoferax sp.]
MTRFPDLIPRAGRHAVRLLVAGAVCMASPAWSQSLSMICSTQAEHCNLITTVFTRSSGIKVNFVHKGAGEAQAQLNAERANPKTDIWFGGTGDPHLQAAENGLTQEYKSPSLPLLYDWAQQQAKSSGYKTVGIYSGPLGISWNTEALAKRGWPAPKCWKDLLNPIYKGEIQAPNPNSSGTAYTQIATLVQLMGEEPAFTYLRALHKNISQYTRSGAAPVKNAARGENVIGLAFAHEAPVEAASGFPVVAVFPCEGTGAEIGSMSIVKGARNLEAAKKFYEFALTPAAQELGVAAKQFQLPSSRAAKIDERMPDVKKAKLINYDYVKYGSSAERKRLIERWEKDVNSAPKS